MKISVKKEIFAEALTSVSRAVPSQSPIKEITGILLSAKGGVITLTGYDLSMGIVCSLEGEVIEEGTIIIPSILPDIIRRGYGEDVVVEQKESEPVITVKCGNSDFELFGFEAQGYPELPLITEGVEIEFSQAVLRRLIRQTVYAVSSSEVRPVQQGVLFEIDEGKLTMVALDGFRMAVSREKTVCTEKMKFVVPGKTLNELARMLSDSDTVKLSVGKTHARFELNGCVVCTRLITQGDFINYKSIIPNSYNTSVKVKTRELIDGVERVSLLVDAQTGKKVKSSIIVRFADNTITLGCITMAGKAQDKVACEITGNEIEIGINNAFILDALRASECDEVVLRMTTTFAAIKILPPDEEEFTFLVMPVRTRNEEQ